jgi:hypothetical protein
LGRQRLKNKSMILESNTKQAKLTHADGRIVIKVDIQYKNSWTFANGTKISLERKYDCFDKKYTQPVNAIVISAENIPEGCEILIHHNSVDETNKINDYKPLSGDDIASNIRYFSIPESEAFAWYDKESKQWLPIDGFDFALNVFKPYNGILHGVEPTQLKDTLLITTGEYKGQVVRTLKASNYNIIFQDTNGREGNLIRIRSSEDLKTKRECEIVALDHSLTDLYNKGGLLAGIKKLDAKPINEYGK